MNGVWRLIPCLSAVFAAELVEIAVVRGQQNGCRALVVAEGVIVALHGAVEVVEFRILAEAVGIDARGFRFPNIDEAFGFFGFSPELVPQTSDSYEGGVKVRTKRISLNLSYFNMDVEEEIFFLVVQILDLFL